MKFEYWNRRLKIRKTKKVLCLKIWIENHGIEIIEFDFLWNESLYYSFAQKIIAYVTVKSFAFFAFISF